MSMTKVMVISNALALLGKKPISSLDPGSPIVGTAEQAFDFLYGVELSSGTWRFCTTIVQLAKIAVADDVVYPVVQDWQFAYTLPADYKKLIRLYPHNYQFEIYANRELYSNVDGPLFIEYQYETDYVDVPDYFWGFFVYDLANYLALSNAHSTAYADVLKNERDLRYGKALANDAQNRPQTPIQSVPIITSRAVSTMATSG